jgi:hypothetical protein
VAIFRGKSLKKSFFCLWGGSGIRSGLVIHLDKLPVKRRIVAALREPLCVRAAPDDAPLVEHQHEVGLAAKIGFGFSYLVAMRRD